MLVKTKDKQFYFPTVIATQKIPIFHVVLAFEDLETWRKSKKVTVCDSAQTGLHILLSRLLYRVFF